MPEKNCLLRSLGFDTTVRSNGASDFLVPSAGWPEYVRLIAESEFNGNLILKGRETASFRDYAKDLPPAG